MRYASEVPEAGDSDRVLMKRERKLQSGEDYDSPKVGSEGPDQEQRYRKQVETW